MGMEAGDLDYIALGKRIRKFRIQSGLTQKALGEMAKIETSNISNLERAKMKIRLSTLVHIAYALEVTPNDLLCDSFPYERSAYDYDSEIHKIMSRYTPESASFIAHFLEQNLKTFEEHGMIQRMDIAKDQ